VGVEMKQPRKMATFLSVEAIEAINHPASSAPLVFCLTTKCFSQNDTSKNYAIYQFGCYANVTRAIAP